MENNYGKIFAEVLDIINNSEKEVKAKIPEKLYQQFEKNTDKSYKVNIDYSKEDWDNNISEETKEILALIYRDYIVSPEERKELIKEEAEFEKQKELELREKYNPDNLFKNKHKEINKEIKKKKSNVKISILCPGPVDTNFNNVAKVVFKAPSMPSEQVAKMGIDKALKGKLIIIPGVLNKSVRFFSKILPDCVLEECAFHIQRRKAER